MKRLAQKIEESSSSSDDVKFNKGQPTSTEGHIQKDKLRNYSKYMNEYKNVLGVERE